MRKTTKKKAGGAWRLYIVRCKDGTLYTGITNDLDHRLDRHNSGTASRYTRSRLPVTLVYSERCLNKSSALKKEYRIKELTREEKDNYIAERQVRSETPVLPPKRRMTGSRRLQPARKSSKSGTSTLAAKMRKKQP